MFIIIFLLCLYFLTSGSIVILSPPIFLPSPPPFFPLSSSPNVSLSPAFLHPFLVRMVKNLLCRQVVLSLQTFRKDAFLWCLPCSLSASLLRHCTAGGSGAAAVAVRSGEWDGVGLLVVSGDFHCFSPCNVAV